MPYAIHTSLLLLKETLYVSNKRLLFCKPFFMILKKKKRVLQQSQRGCQADVLCFSKSNIMESEQQQQLERGKGKIHQQVVQE